MNDSFSYPPAHAPDSTGVWAQVDMREQRAHVSKALTTYENQGRRGRTLNAGFSFNQGY